MSTEREVRAHIAYKLMARELAPETADGMPALLDAGRPADYRALYLEVVRVDLPAVTYHVTEPHNVEFILREGLRAAYPRDRHGQGLSVSLILQAQPRGVYLSAEPDVFGRFSVSAQWTILEVDTAGLIWEHDPLNEGCWLVLGDISPDRVSRWRSTKGTTNP